jgi:hypothetical protein
MASDKNIAVEHFESLSQDESQMKGAVPPGTMGSVAITDSTDIYLVPSPSADPRGNSTAAGFQ